MNMRTLRAHFDGEKIILDEPFRLAPNTKLIVTILPTPKPAEFAEDEEEHGIWLQFSLNGLERAYGEDEIEYSEDLIKEPNPDYEGR